MDFYRDLSEEVTSQDLTFLVGIPYVYHCHHFNLFHDQTVEDALGEEEAFHVRARAAHRHSGQLLRRALSAAGAQTPVERLQLASRLLAWMGHGRLQILGDEEKARARGEYLHYSFAWREKYGKQIRRRYPLDAFAAGFAAAAVEAAFDLEEGVVEGQEEQCYGCREPRCEIELVKHGRNGLGAAVDQEQYLEGVGEPDTGLGEEQINTIARGLKDFVAGAAGDERGLIQGFGLFITRHLAGYYNQTAYDTIHRVEEANPGLATVTEELLGESGHVCVFNTFGNILLSPEWEGMVGPIRGEVEEIVTGCTAIARALGFGHWVIHELEPGKRLVMRASSTYEAPFYLKVYGRSDRPRGYFFANAARAFMQLAHRVPWTEKPQLDEELYQSLFRTSLKWRVEQTACLARGDEFSEVVVSEG